MRCVATPPFMLGSAKSITYDIRAQTPGGFHSLMTISCFAHNAQVRLIFKHSPEGPPHQSVIFDEQDCGNTIRHTYRFTLRSLKVAPGELR
jgi:hypothetical protein